MMMMMMNCFCGMVDRQKAFSLISSQDHCQRSSPLLIFNTLWGTLITTHHVEVKDNVKPVVTLIWKVPHMLKPKLEKDFKWMVDLNIQLIKKPTDWVSSLEIVDKPNGKLCICLYPWLLNKAIKREHLPLPTAEEIFSQMCGACFFSKLDASLGYWQIKVDEESSHLLVFSTPFGHYLFKRLPYGIHSAS